MIFLLQVPPAMAMRIQEFYYCIIHKEIRPEECEILGLLSSNLRTQLLLIMFQKVIPKLNIFESKPPQFAAELAVQLEIEYHSPKTFVVIQGEYTTKMYFVGSGTLAVRMYDDSPKLTSKFLPVSIITEETSLLKLCLNM